MREYAQMHFRRRCVATFMWAAILVPAASPADTPVRIVADGYQPAPSRDGTWIAFRTSGGIAKIHPDGTGMTYVGGGGDPNWNRPGDLIIATDHSYHLFTIDATTGVTTPVWTGTGSNSCEHPAWSPSGDEIAVSSPALTLVQYPSGPAVPVPCSGCDDMQDATWSPDGQWIAFDHRHIYRVPRKGGTPQPVTGGISEQAFPAWSPDGRFIAFAQRELGVENYWHIWVANAAGEAYGKVQITEGPYADEYPAWSPDGTTLYFDSNRDGLGTLGVWKVTFDSMVPILRSSWGALKARYR